MVLEGVYSPFGNIVAMDIRGNKLKCASICNDCIFVGCADFIVQDVDYGRTVGCRKPGMDVLVGSNAVSIMLVGEGSYQYGVGVGTTMCSWLEAACIICEDPVDWDCDDVHCLLWLCGYYQWLGACA